MAPASAAAGEQRERERQITEADPAHPSEAGALPGAGSWGGMAAAVDAATTAMATTDDAAASGSVSGSCGSSGAVPASPATICVTASSQLLGDTGGGCGGGGGAHPAARTGMALYEWLMAEGSEGGRGREQQRAVIGSRVWIKVRRGRRGRVALAHRLGEHPSTFGLPRWGG
jgi:hypothetical protein